MNKRIAAIVDNLHNLQYRVEEFRGALEREANFDTVEHLEPMRTAVNNLAAVLIVAEDNLQEIKDAYSSLCEVQGSMPSKENIN